MTSFYTTLPNFLQSPFCHPVIGRPLRLPAGEPWIFFCFHYSEFNTTFDHELVRDKFKMTV